MKNERDVKAAVKEILKAAGAWWFMPVASGYGRQGIPDFIACVDGKFLAIETKFGGNTTSPLQKRELEAIELANGTALVIDEGNVQLLPVTLAALRELFR